MNYWLCQRNNGAAGRQYRIGWFGPESAFGVIVGHEKPEYPYLWAMYGTASFGRHKGSVRFVGGYTVRIVRYENVLTVFVCRPWWAHRPDWWPFKPIRQLWAELRGRS